MATNRVDRRVRRTRQRLQQALISLILEQPYSKITVQEVLDRADVGRSTFYAHFEDKEALLASTFDDLAGDLAHHVEGSEVAGRFLHCQAYFVHAQERRDFYQAMMDGAGMEILLATGRRHIESAVRAHLFQLGVDGEALEVPLPVLVEFLTGSLLSMLTWWLTKGMPYPPRQMAEMYERLVTLGLRGLLP